MGISSITSGNGEKSADSFDDNLARHVQTRARFKRIAKVLPLVKAVALLDEFLSQHGIRYMLIGGLANAVGGRVRATTDADLVLILGERSIAEMAQLIGACFTFLKSDPVAFAQRTYVMPIQVTDEPTADLSLAILPYEQQALSRAVVVDTNLFTGAQQPPLTLRWPWRSRPRRASLPSLFPACAARRV